MLKVNDLINQLAKLDPDAVVIIQRDPEGNGYGPCAGVEGNGAWDDDEGLYGYASLTDELLECGCSEEDIVIGHPAVVLWPTR